MQSLRSHLADNRLVILLPNQRLRDIFLHLPLSDGLSVVSFGHSNTVASRLAFVTGHARRVNVAKSVKKAKSPAKKKKAGASGAAPTAHEDDHICACDVEISDADATADADLPPARGGVEVVRSGRR